MLKSFDFANDTLRNAEPLGTAQEPAKKNERRETRDFRQCDSAVPDYNKSKSIWSKHLLDVADSVMATPSDLVCLSRSGAAMGDINEVVHQIQVIESRERASRRNPQPEFAAGNKNAGNFIH